jgi:hypothetical protein
VLFDSEKWVKKFTLDLPETDTSNLTPKDDFNDLQENLFGNPELPVYQKFRDNVSTGISPDVISNTQASGYYLGSSQSTTGLIYLSTFPAGTYTYYVKLKFSNKGDLHSIAYFNGTTTMGTIPESQITINQEFSFAFTVTRATDVTSSTLIAQIRTRYLTQQAMASSFTIVEFSAFKGTYTKEQIEESRSAAPDKTKVLKAALSDVATRALIAETVEKMPEGYFTTVESRADKVTQKFGDSIADWNSVTGVTSSYVTRNNSKLQVGGKVENFTGSTGSHRLWFGVDVRPALYATESKTFYVVVKGTVTGNNIRTFVLKSAQSRFNVVLCQDMDKGVPTGFEAIIEINYPAGSATNDRYIYTDYSVWSGETDIGFDAEFEVFALFEKNIKTEKFTMADFIKAVNGEYQELNSNMLPKNLATQEYVTEKIENIISSSGKLSADDLIFLYTILMIVIYGQSLAVGGGAGSAVNDYQNSLTFPGGSSLFAVPFTTTAEKQAYFGSAFKTMNNVTTAAYPPATAALTAVLSLIKSENGVDLAKFGGQFIPQTGGVSGSSIITMNKGTKAYSDIMEVITTATEFAHALGKTFAVPVLGWVHGEADRSQTQEWYYGHLSQFFTDFNTDVKAITGQIEDVQFVIHQTSPWRDVWYPSGAKTQQTGDTAFDYKMGVQNAQLQLVNERANVHMLGGTYPFDYADFFHPRDRAVIGLPMGIYIKRLICDGVALPTFQPVSHKVVGNFIHLKFDVPVKPARFDSGSDIWHNKTNGKQPNWGFRVYKNDIDIISAEPFIVQGDTVVIPCSQSPIGATIWYAANGHWGGGNLCDSMNITIKNKNVDYILDNFAIAFDNYLIS